MTPRWLLAWLLAGPCLGNKVVGGTLLGKCQAGG